MLFCWLQWLSPGQDCCPSSHCSAQASHFSRVSGAPLCVEKSTDEILQLKSYSASSTDSLPSRDCSRVFGGHNLCGNVRWVYYSMGWNAYELKSRACFGCVTCTWMKLGSQSTAILSLRGAVDNQEKWNSIWAICYKLLGQAYADWTYHEGASGQGEIYGFKRYREMRALEKSHL